MIPYGNRINITNFTDLQCETEERKDKRKIMTKNDMKQKQYLPFHWKGTDRNVDF